MIDAHHHLWKYRSAEFPWIPEGSELAADHLNAELTAYAMAAGLTGTIAVQARQSLEETKFLLNFAAANSIVRGVVGWVPLIEDDVAEHLDRFSENAKFCGVRHVLQDEPDSWFSSSKFRSGLEILEGRPLVYELLIFQRQLPLALKLASEFPGISFAIDHIAKPAARNGRVETEWRRGMELLAALPQVKGVKFSGLLNEFHDRPADRETIAMYFVATLEIFGADRIMFGSDWPVLKLGTPDVAAWAEQCRSLAGEFLCPSQAVKFLGTNALRIYGISEVDEVEGLG